MGKVVDVRERISSARRAYFVVTGLEAFATLAVRRRAGEQSLILPVHPSEAVTEALPLLDPVFGHYIAQWQKVMVPSPDGRRAWGFYVQESELPKYIGDPANGARLTEIAWAHYPDFIQAHLDGKPGAVLGPETVDLSANNDEFCVSIEEAGVTPYRPA